MMSDWRAMALCRSLPTAVWFDETAVGTAIAKRTCGACSVRGECLAAALEVEALLGVQAVVGVFGGLSAAERVELLASIAMSVAVS